MSDGLAGEVARFLLTLAGTRDAVILGRDTIDEIAQAERRYESGCGVPLENAGVRSALGREHAVAILKDFRFRRPPKPTIYLVEDCEPSTDGDLRIDGRGYRVVGEEIVAPGQEPGPGGIALSETFFLYPERRPDPTRPSRFLLPPVPFPELEQVPWLGRLQCVVSASPSPVGDVAIRERCGFPDDPELATLLVAFDASPGP
jgi:hypothetical protein